jgi:hypothetical protein
VYVNSILNTIDEGETRKELLTHKDLGNYDDYRFQATDVDK